MKPSPEECLQFNDRPELSKLVLQSGSSEISSGQLTIPTPASLHRGRPNGWAALSSPQLLEPSPKAAIQGQSCPPLLHHRVFGHLYSRNYLCTPKNNARKSGLQSLSPVLLRLSCDPSRRYSSIALVKQPWPRCPSVLPPPARARTSPHASPRDNRRDRRRRTSAMISSSRWITT